MPNSQKPQKAEERKMDWELTSVSHGSHDDSHDSHDSLARWLAVCQDPKYYRDQNLPFRKFQPERRLPKILGDLFMVKIRLCIYNLSSDSLILCELSRKKERKS